MAKKKCGDESEKYCDALLDRNDRKPKINDLMEFTP